jgi:hypothetical protein
MKIPGEDGVPAALPKVNAARRAMLRVDSCPFVVFL